MVHSLPGDALVGRIPTGKEAACGPGNSVTLAPSSISGGTGAGFSVSWKPRGTRSVRPSEGWGVSLRGFARRPRPRRWGGIFWLRRRTPTAVGLEHNFLHSLLLLLSVER